MNRTLPEVLGEPEATETMSYDDFGRLANIVDFKGQRAEHLYDPGDPLGRLSAKRFYAAGAGIPSEEWSYDHDDVGANGFRTDSVAQPRGTTSMTYDLEGRLVRVESPEGEIAYEYDPATGRRTRTSTADSDIHDDYDEIGRLESVSVHKQNGVVLGAPETTTYAYNVVDQPVSTTLPSGVVTTYGYDVRRRLTDVRHETAAGALLASYHFELRADGKRDQVVETRREEGGGLSTTAIDYLYDNLGRLTGEELHSSLAGADYEAEYLYDLVGNRLARTIAREGSQEPEVTTYAYDERDRLYGEIARVGGSIAYELEYAHDANGSVIGKTLLQGAGEEAVYQYDLRGRLSSAAIDRLEAGQPVHAQVEYEYDASGLRVHREESTWTDGGAPTVERRDFLWDAQNPTGFAQVIEEKDAATGEPLVSYTLGLDVHQQNSALTGAQSLLSDALGSTRLLAGADQSIASRLDYDAYGVPRGAASGTSMTFAGEYSDAATGATYLRARDYAPATGRFLTMDPFAGVPNSPLTYHKFAYAHADPVNLSDPSGLSPLGTTMITISIGSDLRQLKMEADQAAFYSIKASVQGVAAGLGAGQILAGIAGEVLLNFAVGKVTPRAIGLVSEFWERGFGVFAARERSYLLVNSNNYRFTRRPEDLGVSGSVAVRAEEIDWARIQQSFSHPAQRLRALEISDWLRVNEGVDRRMNQWMTDGNGRYLGRNLPDIQGSLPAGQYTLWNGQTITLLKDTRIYVELDVTSSPRPRDHAVRIFANDPDALVILETIP